MKNNYITDLELSKKIILNARLIRFGVNSYVLRKQHRTWLEDNAIPLLNQGRSITLIGEASRTGSFSYNEKLSIQRANSVLSFLKKIVRENSKNNTVPKFKVGTNTGEGESRAKNDNLKDGTESALYRAVRIVITIESKPVEPKIILDTPQPKVIIRKKYQIQEFGIKNYWGAGGGIAFLAIDYLRLKIRHLNGPFKGQSKVFTYYGLGAGASPVDIGITLPSNEARFYLNTCRQIRLHDFIGIGFLGTLGAYNSIPGVKDILNIANLPDLAMNGKNAVINIIYFDGLRKKCESMTDTALFLSGWDPIIGVSATLGLFDDAYKPRYDKTHRPKYSVSKYLLQQSEKVIDYFTEIDLDD